MITVFVARKIITMNPSWPEGTAVAVRDGRILEVGTLETLKPWLESDEYKIDESFSSQVMMPGLIDPHLHPIMSSVLLPMQFITAMEWKLPWETVPATETPGAYRQKLEGFASEKSETPFMSWGYHFIWHGEMSRSILDEIFGDRPALVWQRSFHEVYLNSAMMKFLDMDEESLRGRHQVDIDKGHFYETGLGYAVVKLNTIIMSREWLKRGLERLRQIVVYGGQTTIGDLAVGIFNFELEWEVCQDVLEKEDNPFRVIAVPHAQKATSTPADSDETLQFMNSLPDRNTPHFSFGKRVKLFTDGAFFSQLAMLSEPGYIDGHLGEWLMPPETYENLARLYWNAGYRIHVHCTGDLGLELALDVLEKLQWERPRFDHGYTIEHFGFSTPEQVRRIAALGANVSANVYYLYELSDAYGTRGVGQERSKQIARIGSCFKAGILTTLHSDFPMAPAMPLHNAWVACTRENATGHVDSPYEQISLEQAMQAITINAASILGIENETGSIRAGKSADFAILDVDPFEVGVDGLREINVVATVYAGRTQLVVDI